MKVQDEASIVQFRRAYSTADQFVRQVALFRVNAVIPANNQLRYAGYHLILALDDNGHVADQGSLEKAIGHCERAMYDAAEGGILFALDLFNKFEDDYKDTVVTAVVFNYLEIKASARSARAMVAKSREDRESAQQQTSEYIKGLCCNFGRWRLVT